MHFSPPHSTSCLCVQVLTSFRCLVKCHFNREPFLQQLRRNNTLNILSSYLLFFFSLYLTPTETCYLHIRCFGSHPLPRVHGLCFVWALRARAVTQNEQWKWKWLSHVQLSGDPTDYTVHGILQARILEWVAFPFSRGSSQPRDWTQASYVAGGFFTSWATGSLSYRIYLTNINWMNNLS